MSLIKFWTANKKDIQNKHIHQLVSLAGDGKLRDNNETSRELREYLSEVSSSMLGKYLGECLESPFDDSGLVLQDIINEFGTRLGCRVQHGLYRGRSGDIGFDGLWRFPDKYAVVVEVKTTDTYTVRLDTITEYRKKLIGSGSISDESSILLVVGRKDTGGLEAQVRGSRSAWDIRLIGADKLFRLVQLKEAADSNATINKIRTVLTPLELTKVDFIVDLLATTAEDITSEIDDGDEAEPEKSAKKFTPVSFNDGIATTVGQNLGIQLKRETRSLYTNLEKSIAVRCLASRAYPSSQRTVYWYAFHKRYLEDADQYAKNLVAFGCGEPGKVIVFDLKELENKLPSLNTTEREDRMYWHVQFHEDGTGRVRLTQKGGGPGIDVTEHLIR